MSMVCQEDFYTGEELEANLEAIDEESWDKDVEFTAEIDVLIPEIEEEPSKSGYKCEKCN